MKALLILVMAALVVAPVLAADTYFMQSAGETDKGPDGVLVPLGIPTDYLYIYNWISMGFLILIAASSSQRSSTFWAILLPVFAAMFTWFGWLMPPSEEQTFGIIIMCFALAVAVYLKGKLQERFGVSGPGSMFLNIAFIIIIIQASMGFINAVGMFDVPSSTSDQYKTVDLHEKVPQVMQTGGFFDTITSDLYIMGAAAFSAVVMVLKIAYAIVYFKSVIVSIAPFIVNYTAVSLFLDILSVGIDIIIVMALFLWYFRPAGGEHL
jgi:hypothetical protein